MSNIMHNQDGRSGVLAHVAENLRRLRKAAGMSQSALADASGISRRMIVGLEGGEANISLSSLDRLAEALGTSFVQMVSDPRAESRRIEAVAWRGAGAGSHATLLGSVPARRGVELWSWSLAPGERYVSEPDPAGWHEMVTVTEGRLRIELEDGPLAVAAGDFAIYSSAQHYAYVNDGQGMARFIRNVVA
jgi:transcriptional regulator with XRE-family HTH domain